MSKNYREIYLGQNTEAQVRKLVFQKLAAFLTEAQSLDGKRLQVFLESKLVDARAKTAEILGVKPREVYFVTGSEEANNTAIIGGPQAMEGKGDEFFVGSGDPLANLKAARHLKTLGFKPREIPMDKNGAYSLEFLEEKMRINTTFVSVSAANIETGIKQNLAELSRMAKKSSAVFHTDVSQSYLEIPKPSKINIDLMTIGGKEIGALKGSGVLFMREGTLIHPLIFGSDTVQKKTVSEENVLSALSFFYALQDINDNRVAERRRLKKLRKLFLTELSKEEIEYNIVGPESENDFVPHIFTLAFGENIDAESLVERMAVKNLYAKTKVSTISEDEKTASYVLLNMKIPTSDVLSAVTFGLSWATTEEDIKDAVKVLKESLEEIIE